MEFSTFNTVLKPSDIEKMRKLGGVKGSGGKQHAPMAARQFVDWLMDRKVKEYHKSAVPKMSKSALSNGCGLIVCEIEFSKENRPHHDEHTSIYQYAMPRVGKIVVVPEVRIAVKDGGGFSLSDEAISMSKTLARLGDATPYQFSFTLSLDEAVSELAVFRYPNGHEQMRKATVYLINPELHKDGDVIASLALEPKFNAHLLDYVGTDGAHFVTSMKDYMEGKSPAIEGSGLLSAKAEEFRQWMEKSVDRAGQISAKVVESLNKDLRETDVFNFLRLKYAPKRDWGK